MKFLRRKRVGKTKMLSPNANSFVRCTLNIFSGCSDDFNEFFFVLHKGHKGAQEELRPDSGWGSVILLWNFKLDPTQAEAVTCSVSRHVLLAFLVAAAAVAVAGWPVYCFAAVMLHGDA